MISIVSFAKGIHEVLIAEEMVEVVELVGWLIVLPSLVELECFYARYRREKNYSSLLEEE